ncbi:MAG TPA: flagellar export chaperone FliS [Bryobacteraceae bacterium]|nr:flagellar export chaperone FliS [Bryobacteraceae bacterium]
MNPYASRSSLECEVLQADGVGLIRMLYRGALESIRGAKECLDAGNIGGRSRHISRANEILAELMLSVDREQGSELAVNLIELYDYILHLVTQAHVEQRDKPLVEAAHLLQTLLEGWDAIAQPVRPPAEAAPLPVSSYY